MWVIKGDFETISGLSLESGLGLKRSKHKGYSAIRTQPERLYEAL
jgi:hypothetical protein